MTPARSRASPHPSARLDGACGCCKVWDEHQHPEQGESLCLCLGTASGMAPSLPFWGEIGGFEATGCVMFSLLPSAHRARGCSKELLAWPGWPGALPAHQSDGLLVGMGSRWGICWRRREETFLGQRRAGCLGSRSHACCIPGFKASKTDVKENRSCLPVPLLLTPRTPPDGRSLEGWQPFPIPSAPLPDPAGACSNVVETRTPKPSPVPQPVGVGGCPGSSGFAAR